MKKITLVAITVILNIFGIYTAIHAYNILIEDSYITIFMLLTTILLLDFVAVKYLKIESV